MAMSDLKDKIKRSKEIYWEAEEKYNPDAIIAMVSGGNDSAVAYHVAKELGIPTDYIFHINTGTGIQQTTDFVREYYGNEPRPERKRQYLGKYYTSLER